MIAEQVLTVVAAALLAGLFLTLLFLASRHRKTKAGARGTPTASSQIGQTAPVSSPSNVSRHDGRRDVQSLLSQTGAASEATQAQSAPRGLSSMHLAEARGHLKLGREQEALAAFRSAAGLAAIHGPPDVHAEARLELAEAAFRAGDLTSACEHWQMARSALHDDGQHEGAKRVERRMRDNGCPTDWVLTDF